MGGHDHYRDIMHKSFYNLALPGSPGMRHRLTETLNWDSIVDME